MKNQARGILWASALLAIVFASGCWVTPSRLTREMNEFDEYLKKREARRKADAEARLKLVEKEVASARQSMKDLETSMQEIQDDLADLRGKMSLSLEAARRVAELQEKVERALDEVYSIEGRLKRNYEQVSGRVDKTLEKYEEVLFEEKRILMERLRALNESLRALKAKEGGGEGEEEGGGGG